MRPKPKRTQNDRRQHNPNWIGGCHIHDNLFVSSIDEILEKQRKSRWGQRSCYVFDAFLHWHLPLAHLRPIQSRSTHDRGKHVKFSAGTWDSHNSSSQAQSEIVYAKNQESIEKKNCCSIGVNSAVGSVREWHKFHKFVLHDFVGVCVKIAAVFIDQCFDDS